MSQDSMEIQRDALREGQKVVIVDDLLATGGENFIPEIEVVINYCEVFSYLIYFCSYRYPEGCQ